MSIRTWLYVAAIGIGLTVFFTLSWASWSAFSAYQQGHANERQTAAQYHSNATQHSPASCRAIMDESGLIGWLTCLADNVSADGGVKQAEYDLNAQQDMAAWAFGMLIATIWLTIITLFGVFFVWRTLVATQEMARGAQQSFSLAERAHVFVGSVKSEVPLFSDPETLQINEEVEFFRVQYGVENHGKTPAIIKKIHARVHVGADLPPSPEFHNGEKYDLPKVVAATSGEGVEAFCRTKITEDMAKIIMRTRRVFIKDAPKLSIFLYVYIEYWSIVGATDRIMSCFIYDPLGNSFRPHTSDIYNFRDIEGHEKHEGT